MADQNETPQEDTVDPVPNTPAEPSFVDRAVEYVKEAVEHVEEAVEGVFSPSVVAPDHTVTVDFGKAGSISGCLVLNQAPGATFAEGQVVTVLVPVDDTTAQITVDGRYIR